ncbi:amino acid deaminase [Rhodococcus erythropolis]|uniref:Amino acid deaminase n=1 Tax=Rhodococcus erythropolis TaxID=1833 RepID=A0AAX3ZZ59_RHOER|nr:amino acid deaminase [Rhodococcus erythropolis]WMN01919.1 amino acid deaminase [Rhodococcus erythropolis]
MQDHTFRSPVSTLSQKTKDELRDHSLSDLDKSIPAAAHGLTVAQFLATEPRLSEFSTPVLVLDDAAIDANIELMASWCQEHGVELAPHGKTTMSPALWDRQVRSGAWGITVANPAQLKVAVRFGIQHIQLANALVDPLALKWLVAELDSRPDLEVLMWADSTATVDAMNATLEAVRPRRALSVLVEVGVTGGRTGARTLAQAESVADSIMASPWLQLSGVAGYEGALAHDSSTESVAAVHDYVETLAELHHRLLTRNSYRGTHEVVVTAGGSAYFDTVVEVLAGLVDPTAEPRTRVLVRAGAYVIHDDGFYLEISPFARGKNQQLTSAMHAWARVVSRPELDLALLDAGKRDLPFDEGLPIPQLIADQLGAPATLLAGTVTALNDQHAFLALAPDSASDVKVGDVVRLGLSHPCTAFDKWRWIPVIAGGDDESADPVVIDLIRTYF